MKKFLKKNILAFIIFSVVIFIFLGACIKSNNYFNSNKIKTEERYNYCQNIIKEDNDESTLEYCQEFISYIEDSKISNPDIYTGIYEVLIYNLRFLNPLYFLIIAIPTLYNICKILKNKFIFNYSTRNSYLVYKK